MIDRRVVVLAMGAATTSTWVGIAAARLVPPPPHFAVASGGVSVLETAWIAAQSFLITLPGIAVTLMLPRWPNHDASWTRVPAVAVNPGTLLILLGPALMLINAVTIHWLGYRFLAPSLWRAVVTLHEGLMGQVSGGLIKAAVLLIAMLLAGSGAIVFLAGRIACWWESRPGLPGPLGGLAAAGAAAAFLAVPTLVGRREEFRNMARHSASHPLCVLGLFPTDPNLVSTITKTTEPGPAATSDLPESSWTLQQAIQLRDHRQRRLAARRETIETASASHVLPDALVVIVESFRRELIDRDVMPNLWQHAVAGIHCRTHFSGGNATNHGLFSLLNGLDATWYRRPVRYSPLMNRLFRAAGYEVGFFAGHDQWRQFHMDGFISQEQFDVFEVTPANGLHSDRLATLRASMFLDRKDAPREVRPRLALLYLYATHATYQSYPEDQAFQPAADDRFLYPYPRSARDRVWNRYKNSARTVDRFLGAVLRPGRIMIVTGDHGESFLDDDTIGHGTRISEFQNMTPAVICAPQIKPRVIDAPTSHADLLPTLLALAGLSLTDPACLDGMDLVAASEGQIANRIVATRNYLQDDVALISSSIGPKRPFALRIGGDLDRCEFHAMGAIDAHGNPTPTDPATAAQMLDSWIDRLEIED